LWNKNHFSPDMHAMRGFQTKDIQKELLPSVDQDDYLKYLHSEGYSYVTDPLGIRGAMYYIPQLSPLPAENHPGQWIGDRSIAFIEENKDSDDPRYLFSSWVGPRPPLAVPAPWHKLFRASQMPLPNVPANVESLQLYINRV
jgi:arylsulfatase